MVTFLLCQTFISSPYHKCHTKVSQMSPLWIYKGLARSELPCNVRDELRLSCSAQVSDVIGHRLCSPPTPHHTRTPPHHHTNRPPKKRTHSRSNSPKSPCAQFVHSCWWCWCIGRGDSLAVGSLFSLFFFSLPKRAVIAKDAANLRQSHDFTGSQNDQRGSLCGERGREGVSCVQQSGGE